MKLKLCMGMVLAIMASGAFVPAEAGKWSVQGQWTENCSCQAECMRLTDKESPLGYCEGAGILEIEKGVYDGVVLDGLNAVVTFRFGEWAKVYIDIHATKDQSEAILKLLMEEDAFGKLFEGDTKVLKVEPAAITIARLQNFVGFSVPETAVEAAVLTAKGEPNEKTAEYPWLKNGYFKCNSMNLRHLGDGKEFAYTGTTGASTAVNLKGESD